MLINCGICSLMMNNRIMLSQAFTIRHMQVATSYVQLPILQGSGKRNCFKHTGTCFLRCGWYWEKQVLLVDCVTLTWSLVVVIPFTGGEFFRVWGVAGRDDWRLASGPAAGPSLPSPGSTSTPWAAVGRREPLVSGAPLPAHQTPVPAPGLKLKAPVQFPVIYSPTQILDLLLNIQSHLSHICIFPTLITKPSDCIHA